MRPLELSGLSTPAVPGAAAMGRHPLRLVALDHYFDQDLKALESHPDLEVRRVPFERLRLPAIRIMGEEVANGLEAFTHPEREPERQQYARWLTREVERIYLERAFDVFVLPIDSFFYVRALPDAVHALGIPLVVIQKETTISPDTMATASTTYRTFAPFISDWMTVCSERQREFWVRAGADPAVITVTGQPRFDLYARPSSTSSDKRRVLFLSYALDAYVPEEEFYAGVEVWRMLRDETELELLRLIQETEATVVVKAHPQQRRTGEIDRLRELAGPHWNTRFIVADPEQDTRILISSADVVVGFQTTAMYEAVAAGKPVVYAAWGPEWEARRPRLIPFDRAPEGCVHHARSSRELAAMVRSDIGALESTACRAWYEEALGPVDGAATDRVVGVLNSVVTAWKPTPARDGLDRRRRRYAVRFFVRSLSELAWWTGATVPGALAGRQRGVRARRAAAAERLRMARAGWRRAPGAVRRGRRDPAGSGLH